MHIFSVTCENYSSLLNTELLENFCKFDSRVPKLLLSIQSWAKFFGLINSHRGLLSTYYLSIMVIYFLQRQNPPILPTLNEV